jgi:hypothetical protein
MHENASFFCTFLFILDIVCAKRENKRSDSEIDPSHSFALHYVFKYYGCSPNGEIKLLKGS